MNFWQGLLIFGFGCFVGVLVGIMIVALCQVSASADRHIERMALERYRKDKEKDSGIRFQDSGLRNDGD